MRAVCVGLGVGVRTRYRRVCLLLFACATHAHTHAPLTRRPPSATPAARSGDFSQLSLTSPPHNVKSGSKRFEEPSQLQFNLPESKKR